MISKIKKIFKYFLLKRRLNKINGVSLKSINVSNDIIVEEYVQIPRKCNIRSNVSIGMATYLSPNTTIESNVIIGKFCSVAPNVFIAPGEHYIDFVTTHPVLFDPIWRKKLEFDENDNYCSKIGKTDDYTIIGNDVWIGLNAIILRGVKIGDGAVIAAGAVVTKDVPPYAVVAGVPANVIKYRFSDDEIKSLLNLKWWDKPLSINKMYDISDMVSKK